MVLPIVPSAACGPARRIRATILAAGLSAAAAAFGGGPAGAADVAATRYEIADMKAVYGRVEPRDLVPARARIGGTLVSVEVEEGSAVEAGAVLARVVDEKLALQMEATEARLRALQAERDNVQTDLERAQQLLARGTVPQQRVDQLQTQLNVLVNQIAGGEADRAVIAQQSSEGDVVAPVSGRALTVPLTRGSVILPGETVARIAGGGYFLRLALPERHAALLKEGSEVEVGARGGSDAGAAAGKGRLAKIYPELENGRVIADVEVAALGDYFVGERALVRVPVGMREVVAVPVEAVATRSGIDFVRLRRDGGETEVAVLVGERIETPDGPRLEILSGIRDGDRVVTP
ncbi:efflux RND transporter periplasmic adaptor subunit [Faunimonas sp. B44]|uniref:efflux RND transporter periplasmic adaptor subunit n=1 Tax=Faunimonas sp. B44 TaxID=3461493 RepID=UPI004043E3D5